MTPAPERRDTGEMIVEAGEELVVEAGVKVFNHEVLHRGQNTQEALRVALRVAYRAGQA